MTEFTPLHVHTEYSILDGASRIKQLVARAKELGMKALAITDHGVMHGCIDFFKACKAAEIKPIIGCEVYVAPRSRFDKVHGIDNERYHLILLAKNYHGYQNLIKLVSLGWTEGFYTKPRVDREILEKYHEDLICSSACLAGEITRKLLRGDYEGAKETALWYQKTFGEGNYYLELQDHGLPEQKKTNPLIIRISEETGIPLIATNDSHYTLKEDALIQKILLCIQTKKTINEDTGMGFPTDDWYLKSGDEMAELFPDHPEALANTNRIADMCDIDFTFGKSILPRYDIPGNPDHFEYFRDMCYKGLIERYGEEPPAEYKERLDYELGVINQMGFIDYFLIVWDYINYARSVGIPVGPGRGSGAGSIAAYCVGITAIDPMKYNLIFERFLNPERVSMPDFDIDFCYVRRQEVIEYVKRRYGDDHVTQIATFGTMAAKGAVRDVGRVLGFSVSEVMSVTKEIPSTLGTTIQSALDTSQDFKKLYDSSSDIKRLVDTSMRVEGMVRNTGMHAAGVVIARDPVDTYVPLFKSGDAVVTQYYKGWVEGLGLLKFDFLGLRTLTVVDDAQKLIRRRVPDFDAYAIDVDDQETYKMLSDGGTNCVFQLDSGGIRSTVINIAPKNLEDVIAAIALYRPGPMAFIPNYIENRKDPTKIKYHTKELAPILDVTYGVIIYQEQVMQIFRDLAGYSYGASDMVRRAVAKKQADVLEKQRKYFLYGSDGSDKSAPCDGCVKRGITEEAANAIFDDMASFASYAFNKSHSAAYAYVTFQTAYLRRHYPCEFMAAMLTSVISNADKMVPYISECDNLGVKVLPPHVNHSEKVFGVSDGCVTFGLLGIKNVAQNYVDAIIKERTENGKFKSFYDFCKRTYGPDFNRRSVESFIKAGAVDGLGGNRAQLMGILDTVLEGLENEKKGNVSGQMGFFEMSEELAKSEEPEMPDIPEYPEKQILAFEKESTGIYISGHPITPYKPYAKHVHAGSISDMLAADPNDPNPTYRDGDKVRVLAIIDSVKKKITKSDRTMAILQVEDTTGSIECVVFPKKMEQVASLLVEDSIVLIDGRLDVKDDEETKLSLDAIEVCPPVESIHIEKLAPMPPPEYSRRQRPAPMPARGPAPRPAPMPAREPAPRPAPIPAGAPAQKPVQPAAPAQAQAPSAPARKTTRGLFLRVPSRDDPVMERIRPEITKYRGKTPVSIYYNDTKTYDFNTGITTSVTRDVYYNLREILGSENVVLKN